MTVQTKPQNKILREIYVIIALTISSVLIAFNLKSFVNTGGLFPGGFSGLTLLIQNIFEKFLHINIGFSVVYLPLNIIPAIIGFRHIGKKFTIYSFYVVILSSLLTDILPEFVITYDTLLISIFGGIINGATCVICLNFGASTGGTDFISIFFSEKKGIDTWNYILMANIVILTTAGVLFGFDKALYSIIFQYVTTEVIQTYYKRYQKDTLFIITSQPSAVYGRIKQITNHDATLIDGMGCFEGAERKILYSVIGRGEVDKVIAAIKAIDEHAFINVIQTEQLNGRFNKPNSR